MPSGFQFIEFLVLSRQRLTLTTLQRLNEAYPDHGFHSLRSSPPDESAVADWRLHTVGAAAVSTIANFFPRWTNWLPLKVNVLRDCDRLCLERCDMVLRHAEVTKNGYQPIQPVSFPHDIHVTQLGMDCRYCHSFVEVAAQSNVPDTATCMNCHTQVAKDNPEAAASAGELEERSARRMGVAVSHGRLRLLQSLGAT